MKKTIFCIKTHSGFTLVEMMISVGLFSVIMIFGIGAVLSVNRTHKDTQVRRAALDTVNFVMEEIARSARLGDRLRCVSQEPLGVNETIPEPSSIEEPLNGLLCAGLAFEPARNIAQGDLEDQRVYVLAATEDGLALFKSPEAGQFGAVTSTWMRLTQDNVVLNPDASGFFVYGAEEGDGSQPRVVIVLSGEVVEPGGRSRSSFSVQTTVAQRLLQATP